MADGLVAQDIPSSSTDEVVERQAVRLEKGTLRQSEFRRDRKRWWGKGELSRTSRGTESREDRNRKHYPMTRRLTLLIRT